MKVIELITALEAFPPAAQVMLNMTTAQMDQFKFVSINFVDEVGLGDDRPEVVLISHDEPGQEEEDFTLN
jgi:hypothetical protein